jgi:serine/threonine protein kinase
MEFIVIKSLLHISNNTTLEFNLDYSGAAAINQRNIVGFPKFYGYGEQPDYFYLILQFLGPNLNDLLSFCGSRFSVQTVCMLALQMINRIEYLHKHHYLHRDIKPDNFVLGCADKSNILYLIDYGLCKKYKDPKTNQHIPYKENRNFTGTARYVSIFTHLGIEQSRRDDLESIGYVLVYFLKGILPWQGIKGYQDKYEKIKEKKLQIPSEVLCKNLPGKIYVI